MNSFQSQWRLALSNGVVVERLPLGFAAGRWWATFVYAGPGWKDPGSGPAGNWRMVGQCAQVRDPDDRLECVAGTGNGDERVRQRTWELVDLGASRAEVTYTEEGDAIGRELLTLDRTDRTGYFAIRLADGSLIERLPVGHAHGTWRLRWVRSEVPRAEIEAVNDHEEAFGLPNDRFIKLSSAAGPIENDHASGTIGGPIQPFSVDVPDTITHLKVDYLFENTVAGTEVLSLPVVQI